MTKYAKCVSTSRPFQYTKGRLYRALQSQHQSRDFDTTDDNGERIWCEWTGDPDCEWEPVSITAKKAEEHNAQYPTQAQKNALMAEEEIDAVMAEDTPEADSVEMLQWRIEQLMFQVERHTEELKREQAYGQTLRNKLGSAEQRLIDLHEKLTVGQLREAGFFVTVHDPEDD